MRRRGVLLGLGATLAGCATQAPSRQARETVTPSPAEIGGRAADAYLSTEKLMWIKRPTYWGVHYADVASAYGAARLAAATGDKALFGRVAARHRRLQAEDPSNSASHVDVTVYGVWPLELARQTGDAGLRALGLKYADLEWAQTTPDGLTSQARYWIDDVWMIGALQVQAFRVSRDPKYLDRAALMARLYLARLQQPNGLFFHGPEARFHWARGNGWVAAGLAELLSELPPAHADYPAISSGYQRMMAGLLAHQADDGMWRQLIDWPDSWKETSGTAMFGYAMAIGVRRGALTDPAYRTAYRKAWTALSAYVEPDGKLREVCIGTGQSDKPDYYLARPRVSGDFHGQAALLWFASELA